jgi:hypothetical protein
LIVELRRVKEEEEENCKKKKSHEKSKMGRCKQTGKRK